MLQVLKTAKTARASGRMSIVFSRPVGVKPVEGMIRTVVVELSPQELAEEAASSDSRKPLGMEFSLRVGAKTNAHRFGVLGVTADGPADRAGIHEGDVLLEVNGQDLTEDMEREEVERILHGAGAKFELRVVHSDSDDRVENDEIRVVTLRRDE